jgi:hypothetical protein
MDIKVKSNWIDASRWRPGPGCHVVFWVKNLGPYIGECKGMGMEVGEERYYYWSPDEEKTYEMEDVIKWTPLDDVEEVIGHEIETSRNIILSMIEFIDDFDGADYESMTQESFCKMMQMLRDKLEKLRGQVS